MAITRRYVQLIKSTVVKFYAAIDRTWLNPMTYRSRVESSSTELPWPPKQRSIPLLLHEIQIQRRSKHRLLDIPEVESSANEER
jgi:hypothetical protein